MSEVGFVHGGLIAKGILVCIVPLARNFVLHAEADDFHQSFTRHSRKALEWNSGTARFPAILDTGHIYYCSIQEQHVIRWAGLNPSSLRALGHVRQAGRRVPLYAANLWLHYNLPGKRDEFIDQAPQFLAIERGIAVYADETGYPRLPLIGLRTILDNQLHVAIDGKHHWVNLRTPDWRTELLHWFA